MDRVSEGAEIHVPHIWPLEVTNALVKALRRKHITREELFIVLRLAERYQLTTYDA